MAKTERIAARIEPGQKEWLERYGEALTTQLDEDLRTLQALCEVGRSGIWAQFTGPETMYLADLLNGTLYVPQRLDDLPGTLAHEVRDGDRYDRLGEKWQVDAEALAVKIEALSLIEAYTVWHLVRQAWKEPEKLQDRLILFFGCEA